jgi:hypothetical protein
MNSLKNNKNSKTKIRYDDDKNNIVNDKENKNINENENEDDNDNDNIFKEFLIKKIFQKRNYSYFLLILFINFFSLFIKFSIGLYGYSGKKNK